MKVPDETFLSSEIHAALKAGDRTRVSVLRLLLASIKNARVAKMDALTDEEIIAVIQREVRKRDEAAQEFRAAGREDRAGAEEAEAAILKEWLPEQLSQEETQRLVEETITEVGAASPSDMGKVMRAVMEKARGRADGRVLSELVKSRLSN